MQTLTEAAFPIVSKYPRPAEPVSIAVPVPAGRLVEPARLTLVEDGRAIPTQVQVTSRWADGSVRWAVCHALVDLPGLAAKTVALAITEGPPAAPPRAASWTTTDAGPRLDTGVLAGLVPSGGFAGLRDVALSGQPGPLPTPTGLEVVADGVPFTAAGAAGEWSVLEGGPVRLVVEQNGHLAGPAGPGLGYRVRLTAWAGRAELVVEVTLTQDTAAVVVALESVVLPLAVPTGGRWRFGRGNYRTGITRVPEGETQRLVIDAEEVMFSSNEQIDELFHTDVFATWTGAGGAASVTLFQAYQQYPKALTAGPDHLAVELLPQLDGGTGPIPFHQGMAKTQRFQIRWHDAAEAEAETIHRSLQFQMPDEPILPLAAYQAAGVFVEPVFPSRVDQALEGYANRLGDERSRALGWLHWGDGPDYGYTQQGRGRGKLVWNNNEYDLPHVGYLHYAWSGERRFRAMAEVAAQHWIDVDIVHHHTDPNRVGGQVIHSADHVSGYLSPCHEWVDGLLDYHHFTGRPEALTAAEGIAAHVLRVLETTPSLHEPGASAARVTGWALRTLVTMYRETHESRYLAPAHGIVDNFIAWHAQYGGFLAPYHSHTLARVPFMIAIACGSLMRYHQVTGDARVAALVPDELRSLIATCRGRDGLFVYKDLPSLHRRSAGFYVLEALAYAYDLTGDATFLTAGLPTLQLQLASGGRGGFTAGREHYPGEQCVLFGTGQGPKRYASEWLPLMVFYRALAAADLL